MADPVAIERRDDALSQIVGTGNTRAMLEQVERNVRDVIDIARDRGFVTRFNNRDFFGFPAWSLLALTYGLVPFVEWTKPVENGWEARAVVRTREGDVVASAEAMCTRKEQPRRNADDHTLRAMAQTRAMRNALRSCLGAALVMAGFDFADPEGPATNEQVGLLHQLEREIGMSHDEGHAMANVDSYKQLNREDASVLIERWTAIRDEMNVKTDVGDHTVSGSAVDPFSGEPERPSSEVAPEESPETRTGEGGTSTETSGAPTIGELWKRAAAAGLTSNKAKAFARSIGIKVQSASELDIEQMQKVLAGWEKRRA
jgi:hypothetical protein